MSGRQTFSIRGIGDPPPTTIGPLTAHWGSRTYVMAAINLTPDSFSGDGLYDAADTGGEIGEAILACRRCEIGCNGTRAVMGEGPSNAALMIVGEQPGDNEEEQGRPFVGPRSEEHTSELQSH